MLPLVFAKGREGMLEINDQGMSFLGCHDPVVDIGFDQIILDFINKTLLDSALVCGTRVLKSKQHSHVTVGTERRNKGRLDLIILFESDLVITRVAIKKRKELAASCGINDFVYAR
jgi:hypothetical protein